LPTYTAPLDNIRFVLNDVLKIHDTLGQLPNMGDATPDTVDAILEGAATVCQEVLFPINQSGDKEGCKFDNGKVTTPKGFREAYKTFIEGGWTGLACDPAYGGMGMPHVLNCVMQEMICSANMSFGMYPGLSQGAYEALHQFGTDDLKKTYLPKLVSGEWSGTMNLTEPHCGTDLGLIKTKAVAHKDGGDAWAITGQKIFISAGEHDLTSNIIHLVLARLPGAPEGVKGISLFCVPKFMVNADGSLGDHNQLQCASIEHKMGIKASATCVMVFDGAKGWLVGEANKGLKAMFTMMNAARLGVAMQGLGIGEVAYQNAVAYAKDRLQMRSLDGAKEPEKPADPIIVHPDIRRMLLTGKAFNEGSRMLSYLVGLSLDIAHNHPDANERQEADDFVALMTPVIKAYQTDMGTDVANLAIQVYGGAGYIWEAGVEQYARDARIAMIYEGTNGIQALDLVGRKMGVGFGRLLRRFFHPVSQFVEVEMENDAMGEFVMPLAKAMGKLQQATAVIAQKGMKDPLEAGAASVDYLRMFALTALAFCWARMAKVAMEKKVSDPSRAEFYESKLHTARFFMTRMLPEYEARFRMIMAGKASMMELEAANF
jgi:alkylation response protein AidB-like acyl-CoA dehydrogenase